MNRRSFLARAVILPVSAAAFSASGWLMGARSIGMAEAPPPPPESGMSTTYDSTCSCNRGNEGNACYCRFRCTTPPTVIFECWYGCFSTGCIGPWCAYSSRVTQITC